MEIGWTEFVIIFILLFFTSSLFRSIIRKAYHAYKEGYAVKDNSSSDANHASTASTSNNHQKYPNSDEQAYSSTEREEQDPYKILNIHNTSTQDEIASAYRKLAQLYHPDKVSGLAPEFKEIAERKMKTINAAYQTLKR
jgi:DnaJ-domain-containing protein 1